MRIFLYFAAVFLPMAAFAQGQDSSRAERDIMVIAEMLPGIYDNREQVYFDQRGNIPEALRRGRLNTVVTRVSVPAFGTYVFLARDAVDNQRDKPVAFRLYALSADKAENAVRMRVFNLTEQQAEPNALKDLTSGNTAYVDGCDLFWRREAGQFQAQINEKTCRAGSKKKHADVAVRMQLTAKALWIDSVPTGEKSQKSAGRNDEMFFKLNRAREFQCHADLPGVSGGRDIPFKRYGPFPMLDQGGEVAFTTTEATPREVHISLT